MKNQSIIFKGINVSFTDTGKGKAVVFLHGFLGDKTIWSNFIEAFPKSKFRIICIDLLGHGKSDCLSYVHTTEEMGEGVMAVLNHLQLKKYFIVGHSMGGYVGLAIAEKHPDAIRGLVMFHSTAKGDSNEKKRDRGRAVKVVKRNAKIFIEEAIPNLFNLEYKPNKRGIAKSKKLALNMSKQAIIAALEGMKTRLEREIVLKFAPYPVLFIIGKQDNILDYEDLIGQAELAEQSSYLLLSKVGHMGFFEAKKECQEVIRYFISR